MKMFCSGWLLLTDGWSVQNFESCSGVDDLFRFHQISQTGWSSPADCPFSESQRIMFLDPFVYLPGCTTNITYATGAAASTILSMVGGGCPEFWVSHLSHSPLEMLPDDRASNTASAEGVLLTAFTWRRCFVTKVRGHMRMPGAFHRVD